MDRLVHPDQLAKLLQVSPETLRTWSDGGCFTRVQTDGGDRYDVTSVDSWLAAVACNMPVVPTVDRLAAGRVVLLVSQEAAKLLGYKSVSPVSAALREGRIGGLWMGRYHRYDLRTVRQCVNPTGGPGLLLLAEALHVLGVSRYVLTPLRKEGRLTTVKIGYWHHVTRGSLVRLLQELLPGWIDPEAWIDDRLDCPVQLLAVNQVALHRRDEPRIRRLMDAHELNYVFTPYNTRGGMVPYQLIAPESWFAYVRRTEKVLPDMQVAMLFGVRPRVVTRWRTQYPEWLVCRVHDHHTDALYPTCLILILKSLLSKGMDASGWYHSRLQGRPLADIDQAAALLGVSPKEVVAMAERGG